MSRSALEKSIAHWERLATGSRFVNEQIGTTHCALCGVYWKHGCTGCPVARRVGHSHCHDTPYYAAASAHDRHGIDSEEFRAAARIEADFLISLREITTQLNVSIGGTPP